MPLTGVRVLDASNLIAGPVSAMMLGDFGASVIKVEHPTKGDPLRGHSRTPEGIPLWWKVLARNKKTITLDLGKPKGQELFRRLSEKADVVIESYRPGTMAKWGLDYKTLAAANPSLIMAHVTGYGQSGPRSKEPAFGTLFEAMSGFAHRTGNPDGPPTLPPFGLADCTGGLTTALAIMMALYHRKATGQGQEIDQALSDPLLLLLEPQIIAFSKLGIDLGRSGNRSQLNAPRDLYPTKDGGWIAISCSTYETAARLIRLVGRPDLADQPWMRAAAERQKHADEMDESISPWMKARTAKEGLVLLQEASVPASLVYSAREIVQDEHYRARPSIVDVPDKDLGSVTMPNVLFKLSETPGKVRWAGAGLGEHNQEVFGEIGIGPEELEQLHAEGVV